MKSYLQNFKRFRPLLEELVARDVKIKYRRSVLGVLWTLLNPLFMMIILSVVFSNLFKFDVENYSLYILSGQVVFNFFSGATTDAMSAIFGNASLIKKVYVPKYLYPLSTVIYNYIIFLISLVVLAIVGVILGVKPTIYLLQAPVALIIILILSYGSGMFLATIGVFFRDIEYLWSVALMLIMYTCAIFYYPSKLLKSGWAWILKFNPLYCTIQIFRSAIFGEPMYAPYVIYAAAFSVVITIIGLVCFKKKQDNFILYI